MSILKISLYVIITFLRVLYNYCNYHACMPIQIYMSLTNFNKRCSEGEINKKMIRNISKIFPCAVLGISDDSINDLYIIIYII